MKNIILILVTYLMHSLFPIYGQSALVSSIEINGSSFSSGILTEMFHSEVVKIQRYEKLGLLSPREIIAKTSNDSLSPFQDLLFRGRELEVDFIFSGSVVEVKNKVSISISLTDVKKGNVARKHRADFVNEKSRIQEMIRIVLEEMHHIAPNPFLKKELSFNSLSGIESNKVERKKSSLKFGLAYATGLMNEFMLRDKPTGGLGMASLSTSLGYQFSQCYFENKKCSLFTNVLLSIIGLEQGNFMPSLSVIHCVEFGLRDWQIGFGPTFGIARKSYGFFDNNNALGNGNRYYNLDEVKDGFSSEDMFQFGYEPSLNLDARGKNYLTLNWLFSLGRSFNLGSRNIGIDLHYFGTLQGGFTGVNLNFPICFGKTTPKD